MSKARHPLTMYTIATRLWCSIFRKRNFKFVAFFKNNLFFYRHWHDSLFQNDKISSRNRQERASEFFFFLIYPKCEQFSEMLHGNFYVVLNFEKNSSVYGPWTSIQSWTSAIHYFERRAARLLFRMNIN